MKRELNSLIQRIANQIQNSNQVTEKAKRECEGNVEVTIADLEYKRKGWHY